MALKCVCALTRAVRMLFGQHKAVCACGTHFAMPAPPWGVDIAPHVLRIDRIFLIDARVCYRAVETLLREKCEVDGKHLSGLTNEVME